MSCLYCGRNEAAEQSEYCPACQEAIREAARLLFAGLAELLRVAREQEAERNAA